MRSDGACKLEPGPSHTVARVADGETIVLDSGAEVRLVGTLAPRAPSPGSGDWPPERQAREALERLLIGKNVELKFAGRRSDRYGRHLAHVFVTETGGDPVWVQGHLLEQGLARAYALPGNTGCISEMLTKESEGHLHARGIWKLAAYRVIEATEIRELLARRNRFELVEGVVRDVALKGGRGYVNFGSDWRSDFTAVVPPKLMRDASEAATQLRALIGKRVRVRGWIERRNGPSVEIAALGEIEVVGGT